jgi:hypothetical protein
MPIRHPVDPLPPPPAPTTSNKPPAGCAHWFDGCNTCHRNSANGPMMCTMMMCFAPGQSSCKSYFPGYGGSTVSTGLPASSGAGLGARCAQGFCENPNNCPKCSAGLKCHVNPGMMCAGTCYGTCVATDEEVEDGHRRTQFLGGGGGGRMQLAGGRDPNADPNAVNCCGGTTGLNLPMPTATVSDSHSRAGDREAIQHLVDLGRALQSHSPIDSISTT